MGAVDLRESFGPSVSLASPYISGALMKVKTCGELLVSNRSLNHEKLYMFP